MTFSEVAHYFGRIEAEPSRLAMTGLLAELFKKATPTEASIIATLSLGELHPSYVGTQFNIAEKSLIDVLARYSGKTVATIKEHAKKVGDLGLVAEEVVARTKTHQLSVHEVYQQLCGVHELAGTGSSGAKEEAICSLLGQLDAQSARYVVRIIVGALRLGFSDMTLLDAFSWMATGDKSLREILEHAYNVSADIGNLILVLKKEGIEAVKRMRITPGIPIRPAAAERLPSAKEIVAKLGACVAQPKLDGFRVQVHFFDGRSSHKKIVFFSRNLLNMSAMFPDLANVVRTFGVDDVVVEGEAIAYDQETGTFLPFQETVKRRRKHDVAAYAEEIPLKLYLFDILYKNGVSLLDKPHKERRELLASLVEKLSASSREVVYLTAERTIKTVHDLEDYFNENISAGLEGVVVKRVDASYVPGKRNFNWIKLKRHETGHIEDTIDCVILGYYAGHGKRAAFGIGAFLVGVFNPHQDRFETIAKVGTGLSDIAWRDLRKKCDSQAVIHRPKNVECAKELYPDVWVSPTMVCAIRADEITLSPLHSAGAHDDQPGFALRFPRIMDYRTDKSAAEATTVAEVKRLYHDQFDHKQ